MLKKQMTLVFDPGGGSGEGDMTGTFAIVGGAVYDGSGQAPLRSDVLLRDGRVVAVDESVPTSGATVIDATGKVVAPGFIDMHSHADFTLPSYPGALNSLAQGVTTEVVGNCGWSPAPLAPAGSDWRDGWRQMASPLGFDFAWDGTSFGSYLDVLAAVRPAVNCAPLVGHSAIRTAVVGLDDRHATPAELAVMAGLLVEALDAGAWGMSTGLVYPAGRSAAVGEIHHLVRVLADRGAIYSTHIRDAGVGLSASIEEAIDAARSTGVRLQISHLKAIGPEAHGTVGVALDAIDAANDAGFDVGCDVYPYTAASTLLTQLIPPWAVDGGVEALIGRLESDEMCERIRADLRTSGDLYLNQSGGWSRIMIAATGNEELRRYEGRFIPEIAATEGRRDEAAVLFDLVTRDRGATSMIVFMMDEADLEMVLAHPSTCIGSDQLGVTGPEVRTHPRAYGSFARVVSAAAAKGESALARAIGQVSRITAERIGLPDRGVIRPGAVADVVVLDPAEYADRATYEDPAELATGVDFVFMGGRPAVASGEVVDVSLGTVLRR